MRQLIAAIIVMLVAEVSHASPAIYVGAGAIHAKADNTFDEFDIFHIDRTSWKAIVGLQATNNWGVEASYIDFGNSRTRLSHGAATVEGNAITAYATGFFPFPGTPVGFYGKAGVARNDVSAHSYTVHTPLSDESMHFAYGAGFRAAFGKLVARVEYERFPVSGSSHASVGSLGVTYAFW